MFSRFCLSSPLSVGAVLLMSLKNVTLEFRRCSEVIGMVDLTYDWINVLDELINNYNNTKHM